jgi:hypothetical protein
MTHLKAPPHVYHVVPDGGGQGRGGGVGSGPPQRRRLEAIAIGDSASDLTMPPHVARMHLVANAARHAGVAAAIADYDNLTVEDGTFGAGWASAVRSAVTATRQVRS